jgi:hypothetical protein
MSDRGWAQLSHSAYVRNPAHSFRCEDGPGMAGPVKGFGRRPLTRGWCGLWGRRSEASRGGNRGEEGRCLVWRGLWRFQIAGG